MAAFPGFFSSGYGHSAWLGETGNFRNSLNIYYKKYFPYELCHQWLSYNRVENFCQREFNFMSLENRYSRYQSFDTVEEWKNAVDREIPCKIDLGAIYDIRPRTKLRNQIMQVLQHELIIDIDISDYDDVRTCCSGGKLCEKCWKYLAIACKILDATLREDYGFIHIMWIFSGRRGIHAWVCDKKARNLDRIARRRIAESLQIIIHGQYIKKKVRLSGKRIDYHTHRALETIRPRFVEICIKEQNILGTDERISKFLEILSNDEIINEITECFQQCDNGIKRWNAFVDYIREHVQSVERYCHVIEEIMLQYIYPRIDINVTADMTHLLKSPFSVHPKSKKISIPFDPIKVDEFDILTVPTVDAVSKKDKDPADVQMLYKLYDSISCFHKFVNDMGRNLREI